jgi:hypothetical protein
VVTQGSRLGRFVQVSLFAMKDEKRAGWVAWAREFHHGVAMTGRAVPKQA